MTCTFILQHISFRYAERNNLPVLKHVTLPRNGAMNTIIDTLGNVQCNGK